jgi:predicted O-methyltransferase YrrM
MVDNGVSQFAFRYDEPMDEHSLVVAGIEVEAWYAGKTFTCDWTTTRIPAWLEMLEAYREVPVRVLEIGAWEGRATLFFLNYLPKSRVVCVDTFGGNVEHHLDDYFAALLPGLETRFDANVAAFGDRVEKLKGPSSAVLPQLGIAGRRFDIAYVDGSHFAADVYSDAVLTWSLMAPGGIVILDDYAWDLMDDERERPKLGIDAFLKTIDGQYDVIHCSYQMVIAKRSRVPSRGDAHVMASA